MKTIKYKEKPSCNSSFKSIYVALRTPYDEYEDLITLIQKNPKLATTILNIINKGAVVECSFPFMCNKFPCKTLSCHNTDISNDGKPWRRT